MFLKNPLSRPIIFLIFIYNIQLLNDTATQSTLFADDTSENCYNRDIKELLEDLSTDAESTNNWFFANKSRDYQIPGNVF